MTEYFPLNRWAAPVTPQPGDHLCAIYETDAEYRGLVAAFLRQGLELNQQVIYLADAADSDEAWAGLTAALAAAGLEIEPARQRGQLVLMAHGAEPPPAVGPEAIPLAWMRGASEAARAAGYSALRVVSEMTWALHSRPQAEWLMAQEAKLSLLLHDSPAGIFLCLYDRRRFGERTLLDCLAVHPCVAAHGRLYSNFYHVPPEQFLRQTPPEPALDRKAAAPGNEALAPFRRRKADAAVLDSRLQNLAVQQELREDGARLRRLADYNRMVLWETDQTGLYTAMSATCQALLGYTPEEMVGHLHFYDLYPAEGRPAFRQRCQEYAVRREAFINLEFPVQAKGGAVCWLETTGLPLLHAGGALAGYHGVAVDITARKAAEAMVQEQLEELRRWHAVTLGRETRIQQLKREVNALLAEAGQPPRYASMEEDRHAV